MNIQLSVSDENANLGTTVRYEEIGESSLVLSEIRQFCPLLFPPTVSKLLLVVFESSKHDV